MSFLFSLLFALTITTLIQQGIHVSHHGRFLDIVKRNRIWGATLGTQLHGPFLVVIKIPILLSLFGWFPMQMRARRKGVEPFSTLLVARIRQAHAKYFAQTARNHDIFHTRGSCGIAIRMIPTCRDIFAQNALTECISRSTAIKIIVLTITLKSSTNKVILGGIQGT